MIPGPEDLRVLTTLLVALSASLFWVAAIMQALMGDDGQSLLGRMASSATAFVAAVMLAQIAYGFSCARCAL